MVNFRDAPCPHFARGQRGETGGFWPGTVPNVGLRRRSARHLGQMPSYSSVIFSQIKGLVIDLLGVVTLGPILGCNSDILIYSYGMINMMATKKLPSLGWFYREFQTNVLERNPVLLGSLLVHVGDLGKDCHVRPN